MSELIQGDGRTHLSSGLMRESLVSTKLIADTHDDWTLDKEITAIIFS